MCTAAGPAPGHVFTAPRPGPPVDPLFRVSEARDRGAIPDSVHGLVARRFGLAASGMERVERASGLAYPAAYVEPAAVVTAPDPNTMQRGVLFARTLPVRIGGSVRIVVQLSAPLVAYGLKGTVHAILAHEFLHYLELLHRASRMDVVSDEVTASIFESVHADGGRLFEPGAAFGDRTLVSHITRRFPVGFHDARLEEKTVRLWLEKGLPREVVRLDSNTARLSAADLSAVAVGGGMAARLAEIGRKSEAIRRRQARSYYS